MSWSVSWTSQSQWFWVFVDVGGECGGACGGVGGSVFVCLSACVCVCVVCERARARVCVGERETDRQILRGEGSVKVKRADYLDRLVLLW